MYLILRLIERLQQLLQLLETLFAQVLAGQTAGALVVRAAAALVAGVAGIYLMLPRGLARTEGRANRYLGGALCTIGLILLVTAPVSSPVSERLLRGPATLFWPINDTGPNISFYVFAGLSLVSAAMMITSRNPVYSALWFALVLLSNSGLYFLQDAEFLAASTIIIYAGAIIVTFLFVIMLASPRGTSSYDRRSREPAFTCLAGLLFSAALLGTIHSCLRNEGVVERSAPVPGKHMTQQFAGFNKVPRSWVMEFPKTEKEKARLSKEEKAELVKKEKKLPKHVEALGKTLYLDHVVSVEAIGLLLLAAVVGAMLIAGHRIEERSGQLSAVGSQPSEVKDRPPDR